MQFRPLSRLAGRSLVIALAAASAVRAQSNTSASTDHAPATLDRVVVSATRTPQDPAFLSSAVDVMPLDLVASAQIETLSQALAQQPGVIVSNTGATGGQSAVYLRGANAYQTLFFVDGVAMNSKSAAYANFLGAADLAGIERVEVLRGAQSTLYGSSAMGGVILVDTARGCAPFTGVVSATAGSFNSFGGSAAVKGGTRTFGYSASLAHQTTDNDRALNSNEQWSASTRLEFAPVETLLFGVTFRGVEGDYEEPGSRLSPYAGDVAANNYLTTAYARLSVGETFVSRLTLAAHEREYTYTAKSWPVPSTSTNRRSIADWQNTWMPASWGEFVAGVNAEKARYDVGSVKPEDTLNAVYVSTTVRPLATVSLTAGVRYDDFDSFGDATTGRVGAAWVPVKGTKLRATYGTGFTAPGQEDVAGVPSWGMLANPNLLPEKSRGWDVGFDQDFDEGRGQLGVTYFKNTFRNLFEWEYVSFVTFEGRTVNRAKASTEGIEFSVTERIASKVSVRAAYTYLDATNDVDHVRLSRRPRHTVDAEVQVEPAKGWRVGVGGRVVADRYDNGVTTSDYTTARVFASWQATSQLTLKLRVENVLDEDYEEVYGYPALPLAVHGGVEWRF